MTTSMRGLFLLAKQDMKLFAQYAGAQLLIGGEGMSNRTKKGGTQECYKDIYEPTKRSGSQKLHQDCQLVIFRVDQQHHPTVLTLGNTIMLSFMQESEAVSGAG